MSEDKKPLIGTFTFLFIVCVIFSVAIYIGVQVVKSREGYEEEITVLRAMGIEVIKAEIDSPAVIIDLEDRSVFFSHVENTIYYEEYGYFYVFNEDMTIAYKIYWSNLAENTN